jgi:transcriptional regulator with XRE-family HTH domain
MPSANEIDPTSSFQAYIAWLLRRLREDKGYTQAQVAKKLNWGESTVALFETMHRIPPYDYIKAYDGLFDMNGALINLWHLMQNGGQPLWFKGFAELEARALEIHEFELQVVPGLLQTEAYARAVIERGRLIESPDLIDARVGDRLERQQRLTSPDRPVLWVVLDESILFRQTGGTQVMREQIEHLMAATRAEKTVVQVLPMSAQDVTLDGSFTLLSFEEGSDMAFTEGPGPGRLLDRPEDVATCRLRFNLLRACALSPEATLDRFARALEDM